MEDDHGVLDQNFARKDVQIIFPKDFETQKIFLVFCKKEKVLEKFQHAENNFNHAVKKTNKVKIN